MAWVKRERPKIDRITCPVDHIAVYRCASAVSLCPVLPSAHDRAGKRAIAYDVLGVELTPVGELCSFDAFLARYGLEDPTLLHLAAIVRGADTSRFGLTPQSAVLDAISLGLSATKTDDHQMLCQGLVMYDALYANLQNESHASPPAGYRLAS